MQSLNGYPIQAPRMLTDRSFEWINERKTPEVAHCVALSNKQFDCKNVWREKCTYIVENPGASLDHGGR